MPSYKDKYETVLLSLSIMERKILINEYILTDLVKKVEELQKDLNDEENSLFVKEGLVKAVRDLEYLVLGHKSKDRVDPARRSIDVMEELSTTLSKVVVYVKESQARAESLLDASRPIRESTPPSRRSRSNSKDHSPRKREETSRHERTKLRTSSQDRDSKRPHSREGHKFDKSPISDRKDHVDSKHKDLKLLSKDSHLPPRLSSLGSSSNITTASDFTKF
ncbi:hypothetical protein QKS21_gp1 [Botrytis cinerea negative-stranded RNA virus 3]|uniref:Uncharacterized protein n=1 Tax=Botrytis cinerea negative-stranded RNA virus 3 TaxID=2735938 RepID=A0AAE7DTS1_9MONO|nr:hypothetical protein QKS21_gp1 [Botrytis cinerea negative-stranded RNA virus 3]QJW39406.1 hypothetical protein [Botrytis cinerea negative-stranded RNA virus 3]